MAEDEESKGSGESDEAAKSDKQDDQKKRRKHPRAKCDWKVRVVNKEKKQFPARAVNVSVGGIMLSVDQKFDKGENLFIEVSAYFQGKSNKFQVVGEVVYLVFQSGSFNIGLRFATDTSKFEGFIKYYVHKRTE